VSKKPKPIMPFSAIEPIMQYGKAISGLAISSPR
jgi:hypothetical protein